MSPNLHILSLIIASFVEHFPLCLSLPKILPTHCSIWFFLLSCPSDPSLSLAGWLAFPFLLKFSHFSLCLPPHFPPQISSLTHPLLLVHPFSAYPLPHIFPCPYTISSLTIETPPSAWSPTCCWLQRCSCDPLHSATLSPCPIL